LRDSPSFPNRKISETTDSQMFRDNKFNPVRSLRMRRKSHFLPVFL
jgi:hypothetical protein